MLQADEPLDKPSPQLATFSLFEMSNCDMPSCRSLKKGSIPLNIPRTMFRAKLTLPVVGPSRWPSGYC